MRNQEIQVNVTSLRRVAVPAAAALALSLSLAACGSSTSGNGSSNLTGTLNGAGSTAQQAAQQAWAADFGNMHSAVTVNYKGVGSGAGVSQFTSGAVQFAGSDKALDASKGQIAAAKSICGGSFIEVPDYISPIAVAFNVPGVSSLKLDAKTVANIFNGKIKNWNDAAIAATNPGTTLPNLAITPIHRSDKSGTTNNFTDYLYKASGGAWTSAASEVWPFSGEAANGTSGVVTDLKAAKGGIAYIDNSQATGLSKVSVKVGSSYVAPSAATAAQDVAVSKQQTGRDATDLALDVARTSTDSSAYPITLVSYLIACSSYPASSEAAVKAFLLYAVSSAGQQSAAKFANSAPLPANVTQQATALFNAIKVKG